MTKQLMKVLILCLITVNIVTSSILVSTGRIFQKTVSPRTTTKIYIDPQNVTANVGENFTISVKIANVTNLTGFSIQLRWGPAILKCIDNITTTPRGSQPGEYPNGVLYSPIVKNIDMVDETASISGSAPGTTFWTSYASYYTIGGTFNGSGTIANLTFQVLRDGECDIFFTSTQLSDNQIPSQNITHTREPGYFYSPGLGEVPVANFTVFPDPAVVNKTVTFDASSSYDPDGGNISLYIWNFGDGTIKNTTSPIITHNYTQTAGPGQTRGPYLVELTVLDDQNGGSQSKPKHKELTVVDPKPVAKFTFEPSIAVVNKTVTFNASASYDPDPGGNITDYFWNFGDGNSNTTSDPTITHVYQATGFYNINLTVKDDSDNLVSERKSKIIEVVERRDLEIKNVTAFPNQVIQGDDVTVDVKVSNKGLANENFTLTAYYNSSATNWFKIDELSVSDFPKQSVPRWEPVIDKSPNSTLNSIAKDWIPGEAPQMGTTKVKVGTDTGFWTVNPGELNNATASPILVGGDPLTTGGWIWGEVLSGAKTLNGEFSAGTWSYTVRLNATEANITATIWTRVLKSNSPNPQAPEANVTVIADWTRLFDPTVLPAAYPGAPSGENRSREYYGNISIPAITFANEYLYFEFQLEVTQNNATASDAQIIFWDGGPSGERKTQITGSTFSLTKQYTFTWDTYGVSAGNYNIKVNASEVPHELSVSNNIAYSNNISIRERPSGILPLEVIIDVGSIHFRGETAKFFILVSREGERINVDSITGFIYFDDTSLPLTSQDFERITTGVYIVQFQIPLNATAGTYTIVVDTIKEYPDYNQTGTALKSFLVSTTLTGWDTMFTGWNATLIKIDGDLGIIATGLGEIKLNLTAINATLSSLIVNGKDEVLGKIDTALGPVITKLNNLNVTVNSIEGNTITINSTLGDTNTSLGAIQSSITAGLAVASALSAIAVIIAIIILLRIRKLTK